MLFYDEDMDFNFFKGFRTQEWAVAVVPSKYVKECYCHPPQGT